MAAPTHIKWSKRIHREELELTRRLGLELKGALDGLRDLYCNRVGNLPDDNVFLAGCLGVSPQKMRALKIKLLELGYLVLVDGSLQCEIAHGDYVEAATLIEQKRQAGLKSVESKANRAAMHKQRQTSRRPEMQQNTIKALENNILALPPARAKLKPTRVTYTRKEKEISLTCGIPRRNCDVSSIGDILSNSKNASYGRTIVRFDEKN